MNRPMFPSFPRSRPVSLLSITSLPSESFLCDVSVYNIDNGQLVGTVGLPIERLVDQTIRSGSAELTTDPDWLVSDASAAIALPIYRDDQIVSVAVLSSKQIEDSHDNLVGVFEVWEPVGDYEEVGLKSGFFGRMERFANVSSFVRFEKGTGLPGQVWQQYSSVIHDDLSNHPGFLRAAGASAELLKTAIGIPVASSLFHGVAVLISSGVSPLARGFEIWHASADKFVLAGAAYGNLDEAFQLTLGDDVPNDWGLPGLAALKNTAVICDDHHRIVSGRGPTAGDASLPTSSLALPFFEGDALSSITVLYF